MDSRKLKIQRFVINRNNVPVQFPTHRHSSQFWEYLGRAVATFGFLEEILGKAIYAFTATRRYDSEEEAYAAYVQWLPKLELALTDTLWNLAESYGKAVRDNTDSALLNVNELVNDIKEATIIRNVLCHGSWRSPDVTGKSLPLLVSKKKDVFETPIDIEFLSKVQRHVAELSYAVVDSVTHMGWQFPGGAGPGKEIWPES